MNATAPLAGLRHRWLVAITLAMGFACCWLPGKAMADGMCNIDGYTPIAFGTVNGGGATTTGSIRYYCDNYVQGETRSFRLCLYIDPSYPSGLDPRRMILYSPTDYLNYNLYSDPAMSQVIGATTSGHAVYSIALTMPSNGRVYGTLPVYGRVPAQNVTAGNYVSQNFVFLRSTSSTGSSAPVPSTCATAPVTGQNYMEATATFANTCYISTATDLDFGSVVNLAANRDQTSTITVRCPTNTAYRVALNYGAYSTGGTTRRLRGPGGNYLNYQLYSNSGRTQIWGNTTSSDVPGTGNNAFQSLTVHGQVPAQPFASPGAYSDTITVTLTY